MANYDPVSGKKIDCCPESTPTVVSYATVRQRYGICKACDHFDKGACGLISVDLAEFCRLISSRCPISEGPSSLPKW
jgi:hypothetical protein